MKPKSFCKPLSCTVLAGGILAGLAGCAGMSSVEPRAALARADQAMGGLNLKSIRFAGSGTAGQFGQAYQPGMAWPKTNLTSFARIADYENAALRQDIAQNRAEPTGGGGMPLMGTGEQRATGLLRGTSAWNMVGPAPQAAPLTVSARVHDLWTSPHGVIKAALKNNATAQMRNEGGKALTAVSFTEAGRFTATAFINADNLVERVESVQPNPVMGDTAATTWYSDYKDFGGVKFPTRIRQIMGGFEVLDVTINEVQPNQPSQIEVPALVTAAATTPERVTADKAADGVWHKAGGSHNSVAIEMADHMMLVESPLYDGCSAPVIAEVKKLAPGKGIRYVVNSHHHFDHAGGLRTAAAEGTEIIASAQARPYFERIMANPNRISPDAFEKSGKRATVSGVDGKRVFTDGKRVVEVHFIEGSVHAQGFLMVYLPAEKLLIEADAYTPGAPGAAPPAQPNGNNVVLVQNIERLKLDVERILPLHGRMVPLAELYTAIGRKL